MKFFKKRIICLGFTSLMSLGIGLSLVNSSYKTALANEPSTYISAAVYAKAADSQNGSGTISPSTDAANNYWGRTYSGVLGVNDVAYTHYDYALKLNGLSFSTMPVHWDYATNFRSTAGFYFNTTPDTYFKSFKMGETTITPPSDSVVFSYINGTSGDQDNIISRLRIGLNTYDFTESVGKVCYKDSNLKTPGMIDNGHPSLSQQIQLTNKYAVEGTHAVLRDITFHFELVSGTTYKCTIWSNHSCFLKGYVSDTSSNANNPRPISFYFNASNIIDSKGMTYFHTFGHSYNNGTGNACYSALRFYNMREDTPKSTITVHYDSSTASCPDETFEYRTSPIETTFRLNTPGKTGHKFNKFVSSDTSKVTVSYNSTFGAWVATTVANASGNVTISAQYDANVWDITYKDKGNTTFSGTHESGYPTKHTYGNTTYLDTPTKKGYTFKGYFLDSDCTGSAITYIGAIDFNEPITIYAKWEAKTYTITYKDQENKTFSGNNESSLPKQHTYGTSTTLVNGNKTGYTFGGWYKKSDCSDSAITSLGATDYTANIILYAKWTIKSYSVSGTAGTGVSSVYFSTNPNAISGGTTQFNYNTTVYCFAVVKAHYEIVGATRISGNRGVQGAIYRTKSVTLGDGGYNFGVQNATPIEYNIVAFFDSSRHAIESSLTWYSKGTYSGGHWSFNEADKINTPFKKPYTPQDNARFYYKYYFETGYHDKDTGDNYCAGYVSLTENYPWNFTESDTNPTATLNFGPAATINTYTATYSLGGGTAGISSPTSWTYNAPQAVSDPTKKGHNFVGWQVSTGTGSYSSTQGGTYTNITSSNTPVKGNSGTTWFKNNSTAQNGTVTFTAVWDGVVSAISFNTLGGTPATTTIYCKYGVGFYSDAGCSNMITSIPTTNLPKLGVNDFNGYYYSGNQIVGKDGSLTTNYTLFPNGAATVVAEYTSFRLVGEATSWGAVGAPKLEPYGDSGYEYKASNFALGDNAAVQIIKITINESYPTEGEAYKEWDYAPSTVKSPLPGIYPVSKDSNNAVVSKAGNYDLYYNSSNGVYSFEPLDAHLTVTIDGNSYNLSRSDDGKTGDVFGQWSTSYSGTKNDVVAFYCNGVLLTTGAEDDQYNALINVNGRIELYNDVNSGTIYFKSYDNGSYSAWANTKTQLGGIKTGENLYLKDDGGVTTYSGAGIAVFFFGDGEGWSALATKVYKDGDENFDLYEITVPKNDNGQNVTFTSFIVCRYDNSRDPQVDKWDGRWQQTENIDFTSSNDHCRLFTITKYEDVEKGKTIIGNLSDKFDDIDRLNTYSSYYDDACEFCAVAAMSHLNELKTIWAKLEAQYKAMSDYDRAKFTNAIANPDAESDSLERIVSLYDYCVMKYGTNNLKDFAERGITSNGVMNMNFSMFTDFTDGNSSNPTLIILIVSVITGLSIGGYLLLKRKEN